MVSVPALPQKMSLPRPPTIVSSPLPPVRTSAPAPPVSVSAETDSEPSIVAVRAASSALASQAVAPPDASRKNA
jgi:hypothetical protein